MTERVSLWAVPTADDARPFAEWVERLATRVGAPRFEPHVTLVGHAPNVDSLDAVVAGFGAFAVTLVALADSEQRFKCVTVEAEAVPALTELRSALVAATGAVTTPYDPHLSLLYAELPAEFRAELRASVDLALPRTVTIDHVALVDTSDGDPTRWSVVREWPLRLRD